MTYLNSLIRIGETEFDLLCWKKSYSVNQIFEQVSLLLRSQLEESFFLFVFWRHSIPRDQEKVAWMVRVS